MKRTAANSAWLCLAACAVLTACGAEGAAGRGKTAGDAGLAGGAGAAGELAVVGGANGGGTGASAEKSDACDGDSCPSSTGTGATGGAAIGGTTGTGGVGGVGGGGVPPPGATEMPHHPCNEPPPPGAQLAAAAPAYSGGMCPTLVDGVNNLGGRDIILAIPAGLKPEEKLPVIFLWHWLGGKAMSFYDKAEVRAAVDQQRFIAAIPEQSGMFLFRWPATNLDLPGTENVDLKVFDDVLACVSRQFNFNKECVASAGVSAGGIWTPQVAIHRSDHLSSIITLSGGTGAGFVKPWLPVAHKIPAIVLWGGPTDNCAGLASFDAASKDLENGLKAGGHFFIECVHSCGHSQPPFTAPAGKSMYAGLWQFVFDHPYWLGAGESPYKATGLPPTLPPWCGIGAGSAGPFTEMCTSPSQC